MSNSDQKPSFSGAAEQKSSTGDAKEQKPVAYEKMSTAEIANIFVGTFMPLSQKRLQDREFMIERLQEADAARAALAAEKYEELPTAEIAEMFSMRFDVPSQKRLTDRDFMIACLRRDDQAPKTTN